MVKACIRIRLDTCQAVTSSINKYMQHFTNDKRESPEFDYLLSRKPASGVGNEHKYWHMNLLKHITVQDIKDGTQDLSYYRNWMRSLNRVEAKPTNQACSPHEATWKINHQVEKPLSFSLRHVHFHKSNLVFKGIISSLCCYFLLFSQSCFVIFERKSNI